MLNEAQKQTVAITEGPLRIIAGAGTGKTRVLTHRIAHLIETDVKPWRILALTFTNKAAHEIRGRLERIGHRGVQVMTFHALAARLLRRFWNPDFKIVEEEQKELPDGGVALTFDELFTTLLELWLDRPEVKQECQNLFDHLLVDEYQDVNEAQIKIVRQLAESHRNICVVGDPDQTIYSWRGSVPTSLPDFEKLFPAVRTIELTKNYRNPPAILKGAEALIKHNANRLSKKLTATQSTPAVIHQWRAETENEANEMLLHFLGQKFGSHDHMHRADDLDAGRTEGFYGFGDVAILYRTQEQGKKIAALVARNGYPYQMSAPENFWERKEIKTFLNELRLLTIPTDGFAEWMMERLNSFIENQKLSAPARVRLDSLMNYVLGCDSLQNFLDEAALAQEADNLLQAERINLLTLHAAKGLEFPVVIIAGLEEGVLPHKKSDVEEERRLMYVGMTRATRELHLLYSRKNSSRFLAEIGPENMSESVLPAVRLTRLKRRTIKRAQMKLF